jgi:hypothetical protein
MQQLPGAAPVELIQSAENTGNFHNFRWSDAAPRYEFAT